MQNKKILRILKYVGSGLWWAVMLLGVFLIVSFMSAHFKGEVPRIGDYSVMHIVSESMEPTIEKGTYILVKKTKPENIDQGDVICFYSTDPRIYGCPNTHRVVEEPYFENGELLFTTKGDKNPVADTEPAKADKLIGVWVKNMTGLTAFLKFLSENFIWLLGVLLLLNVGAVFGGLFIKVKKQNEESESGKKEK